VSKNDLTRENLNSIQDFWRKKMQQTSACFMPNSLVFISHNSYTQKSTSCGHEIKGTQIPWPKRQIHIKGHHSKQALRKRHGKGTDHRNLNLGTLEAEHSVYMYARTHTQGEKKFEHKLSTAWFLVTKQVKNVTQRVLQRLVSEIHVTAKCRNILLSRVVTTARC